MPSNPQLAKLRQLLAALAGSNAFYSEKLRAASVNSSIGSITEFCERMPFTLKQELIESQTQHPPYGLNLTFPLECYTHLCQTSGTTGQPMRWLDTTENWDWMLGNWMRVFEAAGVTSADRIFFAFSFGPFLGFWTAFEAAVRMGCLSIPGGGMRSAARLHTMLDTRSTVLCCTPTYAIRLAEVAAEEGIDLTKANVQTIIVAGEAGASVPATRAHIEALWNGARLVDHHGMTEVGPVSYGCPKRPSVLHVIESSFIAEVLDRETLQPVPPGGEGELILTNLGRTGSPLLRYRTGDLVRRSAWTDCECGTADLALEGGILGRTDDMVVVRGVNVYPTAVDNIVRSLGAAEYRVEVHTSRGMPELKMQVEAPEDDCTLAHRIEVALNEALSLRVPVASVPYGHLPRFEMKAKRWIRI